MFKKLSPQGKLATTGVTIIIVIFMIIVNLILKQKKEKINKSTLIITNLIILSVLILIAFIEVLKINCLVTGNIVKDCRLLSWIISGFVVFGGIYEILSGFSLLTTNNTGDLYDKYTGYIENTRYAIYVISILILYQIYLNYK
jgi:hypothetical protein